MNRREFSKAICQCSAGFALAFGAWEQVLAQTKNKSDAKQPTKPQSGNGKPAAKKGDDWVVFQSPFGDFSVRFPSEPRAQASGKDGISPAYISEADEHLFLVQGYRGDPLEIGWTKQSLAKFLSEAKGIESWQLLSANVLEHRAVLSRNAETGLTKPALARTHIYPGVIYVLIAGASSEGKSLDVALAKKFLNSFRFLPAEAAQVRRQPASPQPQSSPCTSCHGSGRKFCYYCAGTGKTSPSMVSVEGYWCRFCNRQGYTRCQPCGGRGRI
ncbi:MAG: hypothetical protein SF097_14715 [Acidobacteriota bacterium]|nr:hypothetical protein [Acidobacteriota bacterium]